MSQRPTPQATLPSAVPLPFFWRLRTQLFAAFALVTMVAVLAAGSASVWLMLDYRSQAMMQRFRDAADAAAFAAAAFERQGASPAVIATGVASQVSLPEARVLLLDATGTVLAEAPAGAAGEDMIAPAETFIGRRLDVPGAPPAGATFPAVARPPYHEDPTVWRGNATSPNGDRFVFAAAPVRSTPPDAPGGRSGTRPPQAAPPPATTNRITLAVPVDSLPSAWQEVAPGIAGAGALALLAAAGVAWWLAGSIARPVASVTQAAERVARGEPHLPVPEAGVAEVTQLARSFNTMAGAVERSQQTLRDFVANASHELRTPLTAVQGFSQAVTDGVLDAPPETRDAAAHIHREAERMRRLVEDLLVLSRMEARDPARDLLNRRDIDLADLIDVLAQRLRPEMQRRNLTLTLDLPENLFAPGDATQLEYLFGNLLDNAVKYSPDGATVSVRGKAAADQAHVSVRNTGSHIAPEDVPNVFDRFFRGDRSRSRRAGGSGLGLSIAHEVASRHGGTITVMSDSTIGTEFVVRLPSAAVTASRGKSSAGEPETLTAAPTLP